MPRIGLVNMLIGFTLLTFAAAAGSFVATNITEAFLKDPALLSGWQLTLERSAHGHTNLFAILHIVLGLTLPYSSWGKRVHVWQTIGLGAGSFAMAVLMVFRAAIGPKSGFDFLQIAMALCLSGALLALASHAVGLGMRLADRSKA